MRLSNVLVVVASLLATTLAADELKIEQTLQNDCDRKTKKGDTVEMHYRGTLEDGTQFDASYDRGQPLKFQIGAGRVIQGYECIRPCG